ncbi:hypothetical protein NHP21005_07980 [Helicobacter sp. NHP21005]|nr:hypothetical protein NHP21005_07980 [Helicobacter sp. NHP21005]
MRYYGLISLQGGGFSQKAGYRYPIQGPVGNFFYGVGIDALWTFFHNRGTEIGTLWSMAVGGTAGLWEQARQMMCALRKCKRGALV